MKKNICIVPFTKREYSFIENCPEEYNIKALISPSGIEREGQDVSVLKNEKNRNYKLINSLEEGIRQSDIILISEVSRENESMYKYAFYN